MSMITSVITLKEMISMLQSTHVPVNTFSVETPASAYLSRGGVMASETALMAQTRERQPAVAPVASVVSTHAADVAKSCWLLWQPCYALL